MYMLILSIFGWFTKGLASKSVFVPMQLFLVGILFASHIAVFGFFLYAIKFVYDQYNALLLLISDLSTSTGLLSFTLNILQALGVINAFNDAFSIFSPFIIAYLVYKIGMVIYHSAKSTSEEVFKIGVLVQQ